MSSRRPLGDMETASKITWELGVPLVFLFAESDDLAEVILTFAKLSKSDRSRALEDLKKRLSKSSG